MVFVGFKLFIFPKLLSVLVVGISQMIHSSDNEWVLAIPAILFSYGIAVHSSTNFTPFMLFNNREAHLPLDMKVEKSGNVAVFQFYSANSMFCLCLFL